MPSSRLAIGDEAQELDTIPAQGLDAARDLDATRLGPLIRDFGVERERIAHLSEECRSSAEIPTGSPTR